MTITIRKAKTEDARYIVEAEQEIAQEPSYFCSQPSELSEKNVRQTIESSQGIYLDELQEDAEKWLLEYNEERTHSGKYCFGKTPIRTFLESKHLAQEKMLDRLNLTSVDGVN